jgi:hypothetical protein
MHRFDYVRMTPIQVRSLLFALRPSAVNGVLRRGWSLAWIFDYNAQFFKLLRDCSRLLYFTLEGGGSVVVIIILALQHVAESSTTYWQHLPRVAPLVHFCSGSAVTCGHRVFESLHFIHPCALTISAMFVQDSKRYLRALSLFLCTCSSLTGIGKH